MFLKIRSLKFEFENKIVGKKALVLFEFRTEQKPGTEMFGKQSKKLGIERGREV